MCRLFTFITCTIVITGAVTDNGTIKVNRGGNFSLFVNTSELNIVSRLTVRRNGTQEIFRLCSSEEQNRGCKPINSSRISLWIDKEIVSVTVTDVNTSDEGLYDVEVIDDKNIRMCQKFTVSLTEQPLTTPAISTKGEETLGTNETNTTVSEERNHRITYSFIVGIIGVIVVFVLIYCIKKKRNNPIAEDPEDPEENTPLNSNTNRAGVADTGESLEMVVVDPNVSVKKDLNLELEVQDIVWTHKTTRTD